MDGSGPQMIAVIRAPNKQFALRRRLHPWDNNYGAPTGGAERHGPVAAIETYRKLVMTD
jgi:hypothetical protein